MKSTLHINAAALRGNFHALQQSAGPEFEVLCVLKADAYGHGAALCAPVLAAAGARWLGVGDVDEGVRVRETLAGAGLADDAVRILIMCGFEPQDAAAIVHHDLRSTVWTAAHLRALNEAAAEQSARVSVHLELDTGMARQGAAPGPELQAFLDELGRSPHVRLEGVFSHLSSSEVAHARQTEVQLSRLGAALEQIYAGARDGGAMLFPEYLHLGNSSAVDEGSTLEWVRDAAREWSATALVRPGLALYGYVLDLENAGRETDGQAQARVRPGLRRVATWTAPVIGLRTLQAGETVGYGTTYVADQQRTVALLPVGYADGFRREASSGVGDGWVVLGGQRAPVVGRVSMNLLVVDVTGHVPEVRMGDAAVLLGDGVTAADHAQWCGTIPYEILCGIRAHQRLAETAADKTAASESR